MRRAFVLVAFVLASCSRDAPPPAAAPAASAVARPAPREPQEPIWGEPDMPRLRELFRARATPIRACYEAALRREATTTGKFTLRFTIARGGALDDVSFAGSTFRGREVPRCVVDVVRAWRTPFRPSEPVAVEYPLRFTPF